MEKNKVVCIGEALLDRISSKFNEGYKDFFGGRRLMLLVH